MEGGGSRLPAFLRAAPGLRSDAHKLRKLLRGGSLHTVCEEAMCPNIGECFCLGTATFLILGGICTRGCAFCAVSRGVPKPPDPGEPERLAAAAKTMNLRHVVVTSVTRDDLADGGASAFFATVRALKKGLFGVTVEVLVPDFGGNPDSMEIVLASGPDVFNHNIETVKSLYPKVRAGADYERSLGLLKNASRWSKAGFEKPVIKSGVMVGLGETREELKRLFSDIAKSGVSSLTIGQYLRPGKTNIEVARYYEPGEYEELARDARTSGIASVFAGPLVRSSYRAGEVFSEAGRGCDGAGR